ncbi:MAG: GTP cyclohydrolase II [Candidatus Micrarchaeota archaeon]
MLEKVAEASLPTRYGKFRVHAFRDGDGGEHIALVAAGGSPAGNRKPGAGGGKPVPVRIHSKCLTGDTLASRRCDCRGQLEAALEYIGKRKGGIFIYLDQEGRGIGLSNKIRAYALQDGGMDTVEANIHLGFGEDLRDYSAAARILSHLGVKDVALLTNNPKKIEGLEKHGINVVERIPLATKPDRYDRAYLETKRRRMEHLL